MLTVTMELMWHCQVGLRSKTAAANVHKAGLEMVHSSVSCNFARGSPLFANILPCVVDPLEESVIIKRGSLEITRLVRSRGSLF